MYEFFEHISGDSKVLEVRKNGAEVVSISYYFNSFHNSNVYFNVNEVMLDKINKELLDELCSYFGKPVQIMISSKHKEAADKLKILDFERKRTCYENVIYEKDGDEIENLAFIEDKEIAYVCGKDTDSFRRFSSSLILRLFEKYENIFFEADDHDVFAMELKKLFNIDDNVTWDTYIYKINL